MCPCNDGVRGQTHLFLCDPLSCNPAAETAHHPLTWCSGGLSSRAYSSLQLWFLLEASRLTMSARLGVHGKLRCAQAPMLSVDEFWTASVGDMSTIEYVHSMRAACTAYIYYMYRLVCEAPRTPSLPSRTTSQSLPRNSWRPAAQRRAVLLAKGSELSGQRINLRGSFIDLCWRQAAKTVPRSLLCQYLSTKILQGETSYRVPIHLHVCNIRS